MKKAAGKAAREQEIKAALEVIAGGLSPACHPAMGRVPMTFEPKGLGGATGRSAEPSV